MFDKQNNCEVIITDGLDPILPTAGSSEKSNELVKYF
jgi:hypothetical protein